MSQLSEDVGTILSSLAHAQATARLGPLGAGVRVTNKQFYVDHLG